MTFGQKLRETRYRMNLTQGELALVLRRSVQTISNWEVGRSTPWPAQQKAVLERLETSFAEPVEAGSMPVDVGGPRKETRRVVLGEC